MTLFWSTGLIRRFESAADAADAIRQVGTLLVIEGAATPEHVEAAIAREAAQPTALPAPVPFALVHTDAPGANRLAAAVGVFGREVPFRRMDDASVVLPVRLVVMLCVPDRHQQAAWLSALIKAFADPQVANQILEVSPEEARTLLIERAA